MDDQIRHYEEKLSYETDSWDLNEAIQNSEKIVVIDARSSEAFAEEHIPGAVSLPHRTMNSETTSHLDRGVFYVTYCDGIGCNASTKGALKMARLRFRVKELVGGLDWWKRDGYPTETSDECCLDTQSTSCGC